MKPGAPRLVPFGDLVAGLIDGLPLRTGPEDADSVRLTTVELALPLELRIGAGGGLSGSAPRGRMQTGFTTPLGQVRVRLEVVDAGEDEVLT